MCAEWYKAITRLRNALYWKQAVGSLVPLGCDGYPPATRGLATRWSTWDLDLLLREQMGLLILGAASRLDAVSAYPVLDVATQRWGRPPNWHTSGPAISVLSY